MKRLFTILFYLSTYLAWAQTSTVNLSSEKQYIRGFGGINHPSWAGDLTASQRNTAFGNAQNQLGMSILRIWIDDNKNNWSRELATAKRAIELGAIVFASPWNPPASMTEVFGTNSDGTAKKRLKYDMYDEYAAHLNEFNTYMKSNGVNLFAISVQNEPDYAHDWTWWTPQEMLRFMKENAGSIQNKVIAPESFQYLKNMSDPILNDPVALANMDILGAHLYGTQVKDFAYPLFKQKGAGKELWMTEVYTDSDNDADLWPMASDVSFHMHNAMVEAEFSSYVWWYIRRKYSPIKEDGNISKRGYCFAQFSKFVRPGYVRVDATKNPTTDVYVSAYKKGDDVVIIAINRSTSSKTITISVPGTKVTTWEKYVTSGSKNLAKETNINSTTGSFQITLDPQSTNSFVGTAPIGGPVVSITAPTNNAVYTEGDNITITANATISTGSISKVDFYNGTTLLGTDASSPYTYTISAAAAGAYTITAKATSAANASTTSTAINIQVAKPVYQTGSAPTIDGTIDPLWSNFNAVGITRLVNGTVSSTADLSGNWKAAWDATNLYVLVQVTDDIKRNDAGTDVYNDDNVEIYVDMGNTKATTYGTNDHQYTFRWNDATAAYEINGHPVTGIIKGITNTTTGYIVEVSIPWTTMGGTAAANSFQGFDVMINDDDDGAARDGKLAWAATTDDTWSNPALMGTIVLKGLNCTAPAAAITATGTTTFCAGGSVVLNAGTGTGYTYVWKNGTTAITGATAATYTASTAGNYSVTITNTGGCSATSTATTVTVNAVPAITLYGQVNAGAWNQTASSALCPAGTIVVGPQPNVAAGWSWTGPNGYSASTREITLAAITATQAGSYTATYTDANSCKATAVYNITVNAAPAATINTTTPTSFCTGGSVVLTASAGSSYIWKNGNTQVGTGASYTATNAGSYTVEVTNASGCKATSTATTVTVNTAPTATITANGPTTIPQGASVELAANTGSGLSYKWFNGTTQVGTASAYTATTAGTYTVQVTNQNCSATSAETTVTLQPNQPSVITITSPTQNATLPGTITITADITDADGNIVLVEYLDGDEVIGTSTTAPYSFEWNNPAEGNHVISIRVKDSNGGITTSAPVTITSQSTSTGLYGSNTNTLNGNVYPNPANGIVWIESDTDLSNANFMLVDVLGNEHPLSQTANGAGAQIDVSNLSEGAYVLIIKKDTSVLRKKITVIR